MNREMKIRTFVRRPCGRFGRGGLACTSTLPRRREPPNASRSGRNGGGILASGSHKRDQARREITVAEATDLLINAVRHKKYYPNQVRAKLVLVVDSGRSPAYTFQPVVDAFKIRYATECAESGFRSVYVVGPNSELVYRVHPCNLAS